MKKIEMIKARMLDILAGGDEMCISALCDKIGVKNDDRATRKALAELTDKKAIKVRRYGNKKLLSIAKPNTKALNTKSNARLKAISKNSAKPSTKELKSVETSAPTINAEKLLKKLSEFSKRIDKLENSNAELAEKIELLENSVGDIQDKTLDLENSFEICVGDIQEKMAELENSIDYAISGTLLTNAPIIKRFFK